MGPYVIEKWQNLKFLAVEPHLSIFKKQKITHKISENYGCIKGTPTFYTLKDSFQQNWMLEIY